MPAGPVSEILRQARTLTPNERDQLVQALKEMDSWTPQPRHVDVYGKFRHIPTSSDELILRKGEEVELEVRRRHLAIRP